MNIYLITLQNTPIEKQLELEERLLKNDKRSLLILNFSPPKAIVMGSSQNACDVIHLHKAKEFEVPIIKRFSAGGCVILDSDTIMASFIINHKDIAVDSYPKAIMEWTESFYKDALNIPNFHLKDNDYAINDKKVGGNAQYIKKDRFVHHSSFLWDYNSTTMDILSHPPKEPSYRNKRRHDEFLTTLKPHLSKKDFYSSIKNALGKKFTLNVQEDQMLD